MIQELFNQFSTNYASRDMFAMLDLFAKEQLVSVIGTGHDERRIGIDAIAEQFGRDWSETTQNGVTFFNAVSHTFNGFMYGFADCVFTATLKDGTELNLPGRVSAIFAEEHGQWKWVHSHWSIPNPMEDGHSYPHPPAAV